MNLCDHLFRVQISVAQIGRLSLPPIAIVIVSECLQKDDDECHQGFHQTELQCGLLAKAQKSDGVGFTGKTACPIQARRFDGLTADFGHDVALTAEVLVAQREEIIDDERCKGRKLSIVSVFRKDIFGLTLIAIPHREEVHVNTFGVEEQ